MPNLISAHEQHLPLQTPPLVFYRPCGTLSTKKTSLIVLSKIQSLFRESCPEATDGHFRSLPAYILHRYGSVARLADQSNHPSKPQLLSPNICAGGSIFTLETIPSPAGRSKSALPLSNGDHVAKCTISEWTRSNSYRRSRPWAIKRQTKSSRKNKIMDSGVGTPGWQEKSKVVWGNTPASF